MVVPLALATPLQVVTGPLAVLVALLTQFGDLWFLLTVVALPYWFADVAPWVGRGLARERMAVVVALLAGAITLLVTLKAVFAVPRPPGFDVAPAVEFLPTAAMPVYAWMATASGYSFPSGHALGSTIVFGGLAWGVRVGRLRTRVAVAAVLVALVAASRVLLGLHYLVDVAVGVTVGLAYLAVVLGLLRDPGRSFALAAAISAIGLAVTGWTFDAAGAAGLAVGLTATWYWLGDDLVALSPTWSGSVATLALGLAVAVTVLVVALAVAVPTWVVAVVGAVLGGLLLALPLAGERFGPVLGGRHGQSASRP